MLSCPPRSLARQSLGPLFGSVPQNLGAESSVRAVPRSLRNALRPAQTRRAVRPRMGDKIERWVASLCAAGLGASVDRGERRSRSRPATHCGDLVRSIAEIYRDETSAVIARCSATTTLFGEFETARLPGLSQLIRHLGEAGHGAFLVAFGARSAHSHGADRFVADLDGHTAA